MECHKCGSVIRSVEEGSGWGAESCSGEKGVCGSAVLRCEVW